MYPRRRSRPTTRLSSLSTRRLDAVAQTQQDVYTFVVDRTDLGRRLRESNLRAVSPERKIELNYIELSSILALTADRGWSEFVRRWSRRHGADESRRVGRPPGFVQHCGGHRRRNSDASSRESQGDPGSRSGHIVDYDLTVYRVVVTESPPRPFKLHTASPLYIHISMV